MEASMSVKPSILFDTQDWPEELAHLRRPMRYTYIGRMLLAYLFWYGVLIIPIIVVDPFGMIATIKANWGRVGHGVFIGVCAAVAQIAALWSTRALLYRMSRAALLDHGYCVCGYKAMEQGVIRSCPECGRRWTAKQPPRE
jgi:hypothetical protein